MLLSSKQHSAKMLFCRCLTNLTICALWPYKVKFVNFMTTQRTSLSATGKTSLFKRFCKEQPWTVLGERTIVGVAPDHHDRCSSQNC